MGVGSTFMPLVDGTEPQIYAEELKAVFAEMTPRFGSEFSFQQIVQARRIAQERTDARMAAHA